MKAIFWDIIEKNQRPLLPRDRRCFEPERKLALAEFYNELKILLKHFISVTEENPHANPIVLLAIQLAKKIEKGELAPSDLEQFIQFLNGYAFVSRADRLNQYLAPIDPIKNMEAITRRLSRIQKDSTDNGKENCTDNFTEFITTDHFGVVFTAHPTFALEANLLRTLSELASGYNVAGVQHSDAHIRELIQEALCADHLSDPGISLEKEHELAVEAMNNFHRSLSKVYQLVFDIARQQMPEKWWQIRPSLITLASWVGYDLDGRRDVAWTRSFTFRLQEKEMALKRYLESIQMILDQCPITSGTQDLRDCIAPVIKLLSQEIEETRRDYQAFSQALKGDPEGMEAMRQAARIMYCDIEQRLVCKEDLVSIIDRAVNLATETPDLQQRLCILRTEMENYGLGLCHIHVRLNSKQIHNAIRNLIGMEGDPDDPSHKTTYIKALNQLLANVMPVTINFGSLIAERTTAKRLFMLVRQIVKYIDSSSPVRFLIAETESPFTALSALYFAKLFGVEKNIDISPLFETPKALTNGARIVDELLKNPFYKEYVKNRGRLCVQTGFSDAGRHLGQIAAGFAMEDFRRSLARVLERHEMQGIELIIFNTHGESIGRGAHPADFRARLSYLMPQRSRQELKATGIKLKEELSFQGGDGYIYFLNPALAMSVLSRLMEFMTDDGLLQDETLPPDMDPFYDDWDYVNEFFATIRQFNQQIMTDPDFASLLSDYGKNFLYPTGSRAIKREFELDKPVITSASQMRAIPHNAILHQLGLLATTLSGVGQAIKRNPDQFICLKDHSPRFRQLLSMAEYALAYSDVYAFSGYIKVLDPNFWLFFSANAASLHQSQELRQVADFLEDLNRYPDFSRVSRTFFRDLFDLTDAFREIHCPAEWVSGQYQMETSDIKMDQELRTVLEILHSVRIAIIYHIFTLAMHIPEFSPQQGTTRAEVIDHILRLDVDTAVTAVKRIFPLLESSPESTDFGEKATYHTEQYLGYYTEHQNIFLPLEALYKLARRVSGGITHIIGAFG